MLCTVLVVLATGLAGGTTYFSHKIPTRRDMKSLALTVVGLAVFFMSFFVVIRFVDSYAWWAAPASGFVIAIACAMRKYWDIARLIRRERLDRSRPIPILTPGARRHGKEKEMSSPSDIIDWDKEFEGLVEPEEEQPRRFLDTFLIADEADLGPNRLELDRLDDFIFTARHGYLVHDHNPDLAPCDVMTIHPGMSVADLIDAARAHECVKETAES